MRKSTILFMFLLVIYNVFSQWRPLGDRIKTEWGETLDPNMVLPEYPRPIMERKDWKNLNGLWDYCILPVGKNIPTSFSDQILVPFPIESALSGVQKTVSDKEEIWYKNIFSVPTSWKNKDILLHFGAIDWKADIYINDVKIGTHTGAFTPFYFNITPYLLESNDQKLTVRVWDPTDKGFQPRGKQVSIPKGIRYTPVSGIWQTVWIEPVEKKYISAVKILSNIDKSNISVEAFSIHTEPYDLLEIKVFDEGKLVSSGKGVSSLPLELNIPNAKLWSPESPFLYDIEIKLYSNGKCLDVVKSYCGMRKISYKRDKNGIMRIMLNNKEYFHFGVLDQGWWPDGLYTQPSDKALIYDIKKVKDLGFNMIRKHVKVECSRWYTYCDRIGVLVWQDMPNPGPSPAPEWIRYDYFKGQEPCLSTEAENNFKKEWKEVIDYLYSYPSVAVWVPFNEGWGQFKTTEIAEWTKGYDPSRLVNSASGGNHFQTGDILDIHNYPTPKMYIYDPNRINVLGEYGGISLAFQGHLWNTQRSWDNIRFKNSDEATNAYIEYAKQLLTLIETSYSAAVYTQLTDVEEEVNGLITYDRKEVKMDADRLKVINSEICNSLNNN